jgi:hypothetical protein
MNEGLERLRAQGVQKISEATHIPQECIRSIIDESYSELSKVQFLGFISILEREYEVNLDEVRKNGLNYFDAQHNEKNTIFVEPQRVKSKTPIYLGASFGVLLLGIILYISSGVSNDVVDIVDNTTIVEATSKYIPSKKKTDTINLSEVNKTTQYTDKNISETINKKDKEIKKDIIKETPKIDNLVIIPKTKVWLGYIDLKTNKHYTKSFKNEFEIDPTKSWLLLFGHGYVSIEVDTKVTKFSQKDRLRILYKDNQLKKLTKKEFMRLNKGREW